jgi:hypothetical protein
MKKPNLKFKKPSLTSSELKGGIKAPRLVADLYADLRERRLLPLVALLIIATVAVPFLLSREEKEAPALVPLPPAPSKTSPTGFSVVPADPGLREVEKRLGYRKARDPFRIPKPLQKAVAEDEDAAPGGFETESGFDASPPPVEEGGGPVVTETTTKVVVEADVTDWGIDIKGGFVDSAEEEREFVPPMTPLPNKKTPIVTFVGLSEDRTGAVFLMSSDVTAYYGKGSCLGNPKSCQMLELKPGKQATFAVGFGETRYKLQLRAIVPKVMSIKEEVGAGK